MHETQTRAIDTAKYTARNGKCSEEDGSLSCTSSRKTVVERRTVTCKEIFSPEYAGRTKPTKVNKFIKKHGKMMVTT